MITTTRAAHNLTEEEARRAYPVRLRGVVTYYDPYRRSDAILFLQDATGGIFVRLPARPILPYRKGVRIEVTGITDPGDYAPIVRSTSTRLLGYGPAPAYAPHVTLEQLLTGAYDSQWVEVTGVVHAVIASGKNTIVKLTTQEGPISATTVTEPDVDYTKLIGATVGLRGNAVPQFNERRQMTGVHLYFQDMGNFTVEKPGLVDSFLLPIRPIGRLFRFGSGPVLLHRVHIRGRLTLERPGQSLCLQDDSGATCVQMAQTTILPPGSLIDVVGFPVILNSTPTLTEASFRLVPGSTVEPVKAVPATAAKALDGDLAGQLVEIEGYLVSVNRGPIDPALVLESGGLVFPALLPASALPLDGKTVDRWPNGSLVRVAGVCTMQVDAEGSEGLEAEEKFSSFRILLRSPADVTVLRRPTWWNARHTRAVLVGVVAVGAGLFTWLAVRRRRHYEVLEAVRISEERYRYMAHHDALTGLPNRMQLLDRVRMELERARRHGTTLAVMVMDLDQFKHVNDTLGHHVGDQLLCAVAERLVTLLRKSDTVARLGGDEFVILLSDLERVDAADDVAAKTIAALRTPVRLDGQHINISVSVGVCTFPDGGDSVESLLRCADTAMYRAKRLGRNRFERFAHGRPPHRA